MHHQTDLIDARTARAVAAFFDLDVDDMIDGAMLPLMWHLFYFLPHPAQSEIGADGHPTVGDPTPAGTRRMFAGGRVTLESGVRIGEVLTAAREVIDDRVREGSSGSLRFVTHRTTIGPVDRAAALIDERDIVYIPISRPSRKPGSPSVSTADRGFCIDRERLYGIDPTVLFRFSALTYNAHRIHYDRDYARTEGYPGLVVHGPLQAALMANMASEQWGGRRDRLQFSYRLSAPLLESDGLRVRAGRDGDAVITQVLDETGRVTATGRLEPAHPESGSPL